MRKIYLLRTYGSKVNVLCVGPSNKALQDKPKYKLKNIYVYKVTTYV